MNITNPRRASIEVTRVVTDFEALDVMGLALGVAVAITSGTLQRDWTFGK
jgi:hypothetical protein